MARFYSGIGKGYCYPAFLQLVVVGRQCLLCILLESTSRLVSNIRLMTYGILKFNEREAFGMTIILKRNANIFY